MPGDHDPRSRVVLGPSRDRSAYPGELVEAACRRPEGALAFLCPQLERKVSLERHGAEVGLSQYGVPGRTDPWLPFRSAEQDLVRHSPRAIGRDSQDDLSPEPRFGV